MESETSNLGSWTAEELRQTALIFAGLGADDKLPSGIRFLRNVSKLIAQRNTVDKEASDPMSPAVFLLSPYPPKGIPYTRVPMLSNGGTVINGQFWLVSPVVNSGFKLENVFPNDDEETFKFVTDSLCLGAVPSVVYEPRFLNPTIRYYPFGLNEPDECQILPAKGEEVTDDQIFAVIESIYQTCLITPDSQSVAGKLWERADQCWPSSNAESVVQLNLKAGLAGHFRTCDIREEQKTPVGRTDLEIEERVLGQPGMVIRHALIELKVLRSFRKSGSPVSEPDTLVWVEEGVDQAYSYGIQKGVIFATLCCFDMRVADDKESCFEHVVDKARDLKVVLRRWYIYSSSEIYRKTMVN